MLVAIGIAGLTFGTITGVALFALIGVGEAADDAPLASSGMSGDAQQAR